LFDDRRNKSFLKKIKTQPILGEKTPRTTTIRVCSMLVKLTDRNCYEISTGRRNGTEDGYCRIFWIVLIQTEMGHIKPLLLLLLF